MTEQYDSIEREMGIFSYASSVTENSGFAAVLKARYSDFLVHEVDTDGNVARLTSLRNNLLQESLSKEADEKQKNTKKRVAEEAMVQESGSEAKKLKGDERGTGETTRDSSSTVKLTLLEIQSKLSRLVGEESAKGAAEMLQFWEKAKTDKNTTIPTKGVDDEKKYFTFPPIDDKQTRKSIHMLIKSDLVKSLAVADTLEKRVRIWHIIFEKQMPNYGNFDKDDRFKNKPKKEGWPKDRPNYLKFVLYKENIDTGTAAKDVAKLLRLPPKGKNRGGSGGLGYAGMKDKRGCTSQFCTIYRKTAQDLMILNREHNKGRRQGGGNSKFGGTAVMRVGHFSYVDKDLRLGRLRGNRFDIVLRNVCVEDTTELSEKDRLVNATTVLKNAAKCMRETGFINYFGMQRFGKFLDTHQVGVAILKGNFEQACEIIMRPKKSGEHEKTKAAREKWANRFEDINLEDDQSARDAEMQCAKNVLRQLGRFMNCETSIISSLTRKPCDYKSAFGSIAKHMRSMFLHAYQSYVWNKAASHRIADGGSSYIREGDLVLVEDKGLEDGGNGTSGLKGKTVKEVTQDDVEACKYSITDLVLPLVGSKIQYPTDSTGDEIEDILAKDGLTKEDFGKISDRELAVGGDYRKVICKPSHVNYEIKLYSDPHQPLVKTDLMAVHKASLECEDITEGDTDTNMDGAKKPGKAIIGMVLCFTLPPSAYATIALRELMRRPTSAQYQTELSLEGDCEANVGKDKKAS